MDLVTINENCTEQCIRERWSICKNWHFVKCPFCFNQKAHHHIDLSMSRCFMPYDFDVSEVFL